MAQTSLIWNHSECILLLSHRICITAPFSLLFPDCVHAWVCVCVRGETCFMHITVVMLRVIVCAHVCGSCAAVWHLQQTYSQLWGRIFFLHCYLGKSQQCNWHFSVCVCVCVCLLRDNGYIRCFHFVFGALECTFLETKCRNFRWITYCIADFPYPVPVDDLLLSPLHLKCIRFIRQLCPHQFLLVCLHHVFICTSMLNPKVLKSWKASKVDHLSHLPCRVSINSVMSLLFDRQCNSECLKYISKEWFKTILDYYFYFFDCQKIIAESYNWSHSSHESWKDLCLQFVFVRVNIICQTIYLKITLSGSLKLLIHSQTCQLKKTFSQELWWFFRTSQCFMHS